VRHPQNLFLIGPMGAGKSAVGRQLARMLHLEFFDSDMEIESRTGVDIPFIFEKEGEAGFRQREATGIISVHAVSSSICTPASTNSCRERAGGGPGRCWKTMIRARCSRR
jgi:shikimate kinase